MLWCLHFLIFENLKQLFLFPPSDRNLSLPRVHWVCKRWEQKSSQLFWETYLGFAGKPKIIFFLHSKFSKNQPFLQTSQGRHREGILMVEKMVCLEAWGNVHASGQIFLSCWIIPYTLQAHLCEPTLICMGYSFHSSYHSLSFLIVWLVLC